MEGMKCEKCRDSVLSLIIHGKELWCRPCHNESKEPTNPSTGIISDSIVGGLVIKHALYDSNGNPQKFYSKSAIRKAAFEAGLTMGYETPKPNPRLVEAEKARQERQHE